MNKDAILKTVVWSRDSEDGSFLVESPLMPDLVGAGTTTQEAWESFNVFLESAYKAYLEDRLGGGYGKRGRPAKDNFEIHVKVKEVTKAALKELAEEVECSQGEVIDYLVAFHAANRSNQIEKPPVTSAELISIGPAMVNSHRNPPPIEQIYAELQQLKDRVLGHNFVCNPEEPRQSRWPKKLRKRQLLAD